MTTDMNIAHATTQDPLVVSDENSSDANMNRFTHVQASCADHIQNVLGKVVVPSICVFGIIGNSLILIVMTRYRVRRTVTASEMVVHAGLLTMAISDLLFNISLLPKAFIAENALLAEAGSFNLFYNLFGTGLISTFSLTSTWLIVVTSGLRYVGVCHPLRARYLIRPTAILSSIAIIVALCIFGNLPQFWLNKAIPISSSNGTQMMLIDLGPFSHEHLRGVVYSWLRALFSIFIPGILLIFFNIRLIAALRKSRNLRRIHARQSMESSRKDGGGGNKLTRTLVAVIVMFLLLVYPGELMDFFTHIAPVINIKNHASVLIGRAFTNMLQVSNFAFNFLLYCVMSAPFRMAFRELLCSMCRRKRIYGNQYACCSTCFGSLCLMPNDDDFHGKSGSTLTTRIRNDDDFHGKCGTSMTASILNSEKQSLAGSIK